MLAPAGGSGKLREGVLAQMVNVRLSSDWTQVIAVEGEFFLLFLAVNNLCLQPWEEAPSTGTILICKKQLV